MKKHRKKNVKRNRKPSNYNIFGERCIAKTATITKENALSELVRIMNEIEASPYTIEYTILYQDCTEQEIKETYAQYKRYVEFRAKLAGKQFYDCTDFMMSGIA